MATPFGRLSTSRFFLARLPGAALFASALLLLLAPAAPADNFNLQSMDLNTVKSRLDQFDAKSQGNGGSPDDKKRVDLLLEAKKLLDTVRLRKTPHPMLAGLEKRYGEAAKGLEEYLFNQVNANFNEVGQQKALVSLRLLLRVAPDNPKYKDWLKSLTRQDLLQHRSAVYTGGDETPVSQSIRTKNLLKEKLDLGLEYYQFRSFDRAIGLYREALTLEGGNVEAENRLAKIQRFKELVDHVTVLSQLVDDFRNTFSFTGYDPAALDQRRDRLDKIEKLDPAMALRRDYYFPKPTPSILLQESKARNFAQRLATLKEEFLRHLYHAAIIRIVLGDYPGAEKYLAQSIATDKDSLYTLEIRIFIDDFNRNCLSALRQLREYMRQKQFSSNMLGFYLAFPFNTGSPEYRFVFWNHLRIYTKLYWPALLFCGLLGGTLTWAGRLTWALWDEVTDGLVTRVLTFMNKTPMQFFDLGNSCVAAKKPEKAIKYYSKALEIDRAFAEAYLARAHARFELELFKESKEDFEAYTRIRPGNQKVHYHLAIVYDRLNLREQAITSIERAIGLGLQMRDFQLDELIKNQTHYRKIMNDYLKTAESVLEVRRAGGPRGESPAEPAQPQRPQGGKPA